jgi:hypothetical protein
MRTQTVTIRLALHECALIRRRAADIGLTKSAFAANLVLRGLENESTSRLPNLLDKLDDKLQRLEKDLNERPNGLRPGTGDVVQLQHQAFMIEVLLLLRYLVRDDLKVKGEIGRKIQKAVGDVRVAGT